MRMPTGKMAPLIGLAAGVLAPSAATMGGAVPAAVMFHLASVFTQESTPKPHAAERREERERPAPGWKENRRT